MPHRRKTRIQFKTKTQIPRRVQYVNTTTPAPHVCVKHNNGSEQENTVQDQSPEKGAHPSCNIFAVPQYNTVMLKQNEVKAVLTMRPVVHQELTPRTKEVIAPMINQKLNFAPHHSVFKDLPPLNVNDSLRDIKRPKASTNKKANASALEPNLMDYVEKIEHLEARMLEPDVQFDSSYDDFDFLGAYKRVYNGRNDN